MKEKIKIKKRKKQPKKNVKKWMQNRKFCRKGNAKTN